jgi:hypothetical protein
VIASWSLTLSTIELLRTSPSPNPPSSTPSCTIASYQGPSPLAQSFCAWLKMASNFHRRSLISPSSEDRHPRTPRSLSQPARDHPSPPQITHPTPQSHVLQQSFIKIEPSHRNQTLPHVHSSGHFRLAPPPRNNPQSGR